MRQRRRKRRRCVGTGCWNGAGGGIGTGGHGSRGESACGGDLEGLLGGCFGDVAVASLAEARATHAVGFGLVAFDSS